MIFFAMSSSYLKRMELLALLGFRSVTGRKNNSTFDFSHLKVFQKAGIDIF